MRTAYSANVSDFTRVILMSPYISESSGQYLEHFTCKERTGWGFGSAEKAPGQAGARRERDGTGRFGEMSLSSADVALGTDLTVSSPLRQP